MERVEVWPLSLNEQGYRGANRSLKRDPPPSGSRRQLPVVEDLPTALRVAHKQLFTLHLKQTEEE
jgi:hypothetical protein